MGVKSRYKQTEAGRIPEDWQVKPLGEAATFLDGRRRPVKDSDRAKMQGDIPYYGASGIVDYVNDYLFDDDLVLLGEDGENILSRNCPLAFRVSGKAWVNNHAHVLKPSPHVNITFLANYLESLNYERYNSGTAQPKLNKATCLKLPVALPPSTEEQEAIAEALADADALIESLEQLLAKKRLLKQGAMQELLTGKKRLPGFTPSTPSFQATNFGQLPSDWNLTPLHQVSAFITKGSTPTTYGFSWQSAGVLFLRSECVSETGLDLSESMYISEEAHRVLRRSEVQTGDILITITGNVGRVIQIADELTIANINQHIARIRIIDQQVSIPFVFHFLSQPVVRKYFNLITTGQAYPQISLKQVRETRIPLPLYKEQSAISSILSDMDAEITALETKLTKARHLKQAMMQELLTGRIRLVWANAQSPF